MTSSTADRRQPWGRACGLLGGCVATLSGVFQQVDPDVILVRAIVTGTVIAIAVCMLRAVMNAFDSDEALDD